MAYASPVESHELQKLLPDDQAETGQNDVRILNDTRNKVTPEDDNEDNEIFTGNSSIQENKETVTPGDDNEHDEIFTGNSSIQENKETDADELKRWTDSTADPKQQENAIYVASGRVPNGTVPHKGAEGTKAHGNEILEIFTEDGSPHENGKIEKVETEKVCYNGTADDAQENIANSTKIDAVGSTSNPDQHEIGSYVASGGGVSNDKVSNNGTADGTLQANDNEIDEILIDGSIQRDERIGYDGNTRSQKPVRYISFDLSDNKREDSDSDEPHSYQGTKNTKEDFWPSPLPDNRNPGCYLKLRCRSRSDRLREKFNQLCLHIHNHHDKEMEYILGEEDKKNQAKLLVMEDDEGLSCLMKAITRQSFDCLKLLLERFKKIWPSFANYNIKQLGGLETKNKTNLFHVAAEFVNQKEIIDFLLKDCPSKEEIVNKEDKNGATPLLVACQTGNIITMSRLVKERAVKIDRIDKHGNSPIYHVAKSGCAETLTLFLEHASHSDEDYERLFTEKKLYGGKGTILQALIESKSPDTLWECFKNGRERELIQKCLSIELKNDSCFLHKVCCKPLVAIVDMAVSENSNLLYELDKEGMTPLMRATEGEQVEIVDAILAHENGRNTISTGRKSNGRNALMIACEKDFDEIAKLIMMEGSIVELDAVDEAGQNVFHIAARNTKVLKAILDVCSTNDKYKNYKETLKAKDNKGYASLHYAAFFGLPKNVNLLLEHDVPYNIANSRSGRLVIHEASWLYSNLPTVKALVSYVENNYGEEAKKEFINASDSISQTSLHIAASCGKHRTVEYLLEHGAIMKSDCEREIPLHLAAASGCPKTLGHLLRRFPNFVDHENRVGETPAMFAAVDGRTETLQLLFEFKARLQVHSNSVKNQKTCLEWAVINKMSDTASIILDHDDWKADMERASIGADGLLAVMVKHMPQLATEVLTKCVTEIGDHGEKRFDFFALQTVEGEQSNSNDPKNRETEKKKVTSMQALEAMIDNSSDQCLRHIVVQEFLKEKWTKRVRRWYIAALVLYAIFLISLTTYIGLVKSGGYSSNDWRVVFSKWICGVCACLGIVVEIIKVLYRKRTYAFSTCVAYLSVSFMYICVFIFLPAKSKKSECPWQAGAIAIFLAWINFIWFLKRIPAIGIYMIMVKKIFVTFLKVLIPLMFFIMAFAMTFFTLDKADLENINNEREGFDTIPHSLLTTFAMMAGDINYHEDNGFLGMVSGTGEGLTITIFWVIAVIVLTILISNLLTALAVGDTGEILRRSIGEKRVQRARFVVDLEKFLSKLPWMGANFVEPLCKSPKSKQSCLKRLYRKLIETVCPNFAFAESGEEKSPGTGCHECSSVLEQLAELKASLEVIQRNQEVLLQKKNKQRMMRESPRRNSKALLKTQGSYLGTCSL